MQLRKRYFLTFFIVLIIILLIKRFYVIENQTLIVNNKFLSLAKDKSIHSLLPSNIHKLITLLIRFTGNQQLVTFIRNSVDSYLKAFPLIKIVIVSDQLIVPTNFLNSSYADNVQHVVLNFDLLTFNSDRNPFSYIQTKYLFIIPEGALSISINTFQKLLVEYEISGCGFVAIRTGENNNCLKIKSLLREWTLEYEKEDGNSCDGVSGLHGIFTETNLLEEIGEPFLQPFPESLYIKSKLKNLKVVLSNEKMRMLAKTKRLDSKMLFLMQNHRIRMNVLLKIKKVIRENGVIEWYGCNRNTSRCFSDTINSMPKYVYEGRWTPPCCLRILRETARHTIQVLEKHRVRYWLEGGSLLGAMRTGDIIPWDYDVDVGIYKDDVYKCPWLKKVDGVSYKSSETVIDDKGFVWEKSKPDEGNFYRVQASSSNHMHVDIFPFYPKNGIMTKDTWFPTHPQDKEFPEQYLKPLTTIDFIGIKACAPNNIREFLEFKFGKGVIEHPQYPDSKFVFPNNSSS